MAHEHHVDENENELSMMAAELMRHFEAHPDYEGKKLIVAISDGDEAMMSTCGYEEGEEGLVVEHMISHARAVMRVHGGELNLIVQEEPGGQG